MQKILPKGESDQLVNSLLLKILLKWRWRLTVAFSSMKMWPGKEHCGMGSCATICEMLSTTFSMPDSMLSNLFRLTCIGKAA